MFPEKCLYLLMLQIIFLWTYTHIFLLLLWRFSKVHKIHRLIKIFYQDSKYTKTLLILIHFCYRNFFFLAGHFKVKPRDKVISSISISVVCIFCAHVQQETGAREYVINTESRKAWRTTLQMSLSEVWVFVIWEKTEIQFQEAWNLYFLLSWVTIWKVISHIVNRIYSIFI